MISHNNDYETPSTFRVNVGLSTVTVEGTTRDEIIEQARKKLSLDMPRMWDVIQAIDDRRFLISELD